MNHQNIFIKFLNLENRWFYFESLNRVRPSFGCEIIAYSTYEKSELTHDATRHNNNQSIRQTLLNIQH